MIGSIDLTYGATHASSSSGSGCQSETPARVGGGFDVPALPHAVKRVSKYGRGFALRSCSGIGAGAARNTQW